MNIENNNVFNNNNNNNNTGGFMEMVFEKEPEPDEGTQGVTEADHRLAQRLTEAGRVPNNNLLIPETGNTEETEVQGNAGYNPAPGIDDEMEVQGDAGHNSENQERTKKMTRAEKYVQGNTLIHNQNGQSGRATRSGAKTVLKWSALDQRLSKACRIAACTVEEVQGNNSMPSPYAPTVSSVEGADPSLYLKVTWQSIAHLFSYYMDGTEENVNKVKGQTNSEKEEINEEDDDMEEDIAKEEEGIAEEDLEDREEELETNRSTKDKNTSNRNEWPAMPKFTKGKVVYIPIAFLHALAAKQNPWPELTSGYNRLWVALRDGLGRLIFCLHDSSWSWHHYTEANRLKIAWRFALGAITPPSGAGGGKPPRYQVVPVGELKIKITAEGEERWRHRTGGAQALFTTFIDEINKKKKTNVDDGKVSLHTEDGIPTGYRLLSEDPFGLYRTYISVEGYNSYMNFLLLGAVTQDKEVETYRSRRKIIDTRALPKRLEKTQEEKERIEKENQDPKDKISPLDRTRINQNSMKAKDKADMDVIRRNGRDAIKRGDTRAKVEEKSSRDIQTLTIINVNARKIELAKGRRQFETKDQGDVMASSAPDTARKLLDWQWIDPKSRIIGRVRTTKRQTDYHPNEMFNGLYIAEWLHLSAYSWGGLADVQPDATVGKEGSSQIHPNFVLGTSETNSAMTRWEKAWQDLIEHEGELLNAAGENGKAYGGQLTIVRHPFRKISKKESTAIVSESDENKGASSTGMQGLDVEQPGPQNNGNEQKPNLKIPAKTGTKVYASFLHDVAHEPAANKPGIIQWAPESTQLDKTLQRAAKEFRWICYQFDYDLHINAVSKILRRRDGFKGSTRFYPFRRMLYHKIEHDLDAKLWKDMLNEALTTTWTL
ncbi:uncharacterized protein TrAtP1_005436 [Trichoderma atroviride]|uniref:uncharacterized protein n=1 Tax=Hypocrea atroviridis TaxID=63577 RepID=UPI0033242FB5|nr:hypothetical protein TrAtP1_005436 [Trichoderma atroviride]